MLTMMDYPALWQPALCSKQIKIGLCYNGENGMCDQNKPPTHLGFIGEVCEDWLEDFVVDFHLMLLLSLY